MKATMLIGLTGAAAASAAALARPLEINWCTIDGGGGTSAAGTLSLSGTIGQHDAGVMSGATFTLLGGFWPGPEPHSCYPDCNGVGGLTIADFGCFQTKFVAGDPYADCNGVGGLTIADFGCFQTKFVAGCP